jgi:hypothetical protein
MREPPGASPHDPKTTATSGARKKTTRLHRGLWILLVPFAALLWTPFYNFAEPSLFGIPFFYWYQMSWTVVCAAILGAVYLYEEGRRK